MIGQSVEPRARSSNVGFTRWPERVSPIVNELGSIELERARWRLRAPFGKSRNELVPLAFSESSKGSIGGEGK
jgi:hypothetical protein